MNNRTSGPRPFPWKKPSRILSPQRTTPWKRHAWEEAFDLFRQADTRPPLEADDLVRFAEVAWWAGRIDDCIDLRSRAFRVYLEADRRDLAAGEAVQLAWHHGGKLRSPWPPGGWLEPPVCSRGNPNHPPSVIWPGCGPSCPRGGDLEEALAE